MTRLCVLAAASTVAATAALAQTPQPFPRPSAPAQQQPSPQPPPAPAAPAPAASAPDRASAAPADGTPNEATLGVPVYPTSQFLASYDAGRAQRYYLFGSTAPFADLVAYYRSVLKERGDQVFTQPPTHMFEVGRFREDLMAFPPSVTIKDWTWGGSMGYPNPQPGAQPARFPTVVMIVPVPPVAPRN